MNITRYITGTDTWEGVLDAIRRDDTNKMDASVRTESIEVVEGRLLIPRNAIKEFRSDFTRPFDAPDSSTFEPPESNVDGSPDLVALSLSDHALTQIAGRLEIPARYLKRKYKEGAWSVVDIAIRDDLDRHAGRVLIRLKGYTVRAYLSSKYVRLNNHEVFEDVAEIISTHTSLRSFHLDSDGVWLKALFPALSWDGPDGTTYRLGMMLGNSEIGSRSVTCEPFIYRQVCTNDLVVQTDEMFSHRHIFIDRAQLRMGLRKAIAAAVKAGDEMAERIEKAAAEEVEDPKDLIEKIASKARYSQKFTDTVKQSWEAEPVNSKWGVINALTNAAQTLEGDRRVEVERMAGSLFLARDLRSTRVPTTPASDLN